MSLVSPTVIRATVKKDLLLFFSDRRAVIMAFAMPIVIASFFGFIFRGDSGGAPQSRLDVLVVDEDGSAISKQIVASMAGDPNLASTIVGGDTARERVKSGASPVAVIIPAGFGDSAGRAFFRGDGRPQLRILYDPSRSMERAMVSGLMTQHVMEAVSREMFGGSHGQQLLDELVEQAGATSMSPQRQMMLRQLVVSAKRFSATDSGSGARTGLSRPYDVHEEAVTAQSNTAYNGYAHSFAGMGIQFLLFAAINLGIELLTERQQGLWKRLRSAPVSRATLLGGKLTSATVIGSLVLFVSFAFAIVVFKVRIAGSVAGFLGVGVACALMASGYGLLVASLGKTPKAARGASIFATLIMVMLGGAWVPTFVFPQWLQNLTVVVPTRWAVDGFDAMTWRGLDFASAVAPIVVLLGFALLFTTVAVWRFRWEEA
ncbi:MAG: ABC transporter permease [Gemmatimonadaceae bacterium]